MVSSAFTSGLKCVVLYLFYLGQARTVEFILSYAKCDKNVYLSRTNEMQEGQVGVSSHGYVEPSKTSHVLLYECTP